MATSITHNRDRERYEIIVDGELGGYAQYLDYGDIRDFHHTVVEPAFQGRGLSKPLIKYALDEAVAAGMKIRPSCSAVARFIDKAGAEYAAALAD